MNPSHTARYQGSEATIHYPFHPRSGERVEIIRRHRFRDKTMFVVRQLAGTLAQIPAWMFAPAVAAAAVTDRPRVALEGLRDLRHPYARKVRIALAKKGIPFELITEVPWDSTTRTPRYNPLEKLPVLIPEAGDPVYESRFILEFLEIKHPEPRLVPEARTSEQGLGRAAAAQDRGRAEGARADRR